MHYAQKLCTNHMHITIATVSTDTDSETDNQNSTGLHQQLKNLF